MRPDPVGLSPGTVSPFRSLTIPMSRCHRKHKASERQITWKQLFVTIVAVLFFPHLNGVCVEQDSITKKMRLIKQT